MLCSIYKSSKKEGMYLYVPKKDDFSDVPEELKKVFGTPMFVMVIKMDGRTLAQVDIEKVKHSLKTDGFFLQVPPPVENQLEKYKEQKAARS
ncbi:YcgL domain-containing protein [Vibrio tapetis subsp. quintayensis]|uniref:YcgL domain-containing protein n=1 Tax=Vibrio tapetis TaxID=52443 RepID=UPI0025B562B4|nr:YcgL domain-containing protein [Vibrio tapetis]MDN3682191.1 YcgL domain-containing protein [Vibrio tapetis subsp. quintayensis]